MLDVLAAYEADPRSKIYITTAGRSSVLSGLAAGQVSAPVIAMPPYLEEFAGCDILSSLRMPSGVAPAVILEPGKAPLPAAKVPSLVDLELEQRVQEAQEEQRRRLLDADAAIQHQNKEITL